MSTVHDLLELALRLQELRTAPPPSLRPYLGRQRDWPARHQESKPAPERVTGPHNAPQRQSAWNWKSKGPST